MAQQNPTEEVKDVPLDQAFIVTFLQPMDQQSVEEAVSIINRETQPTHAAEIHMG